MKKQRSGPYQKASPPVSRRQEHLIVAACIGVLMFGLALFGTVGGIFTQRAALDRLLRQWSVTYHLSPSQVERIREIELDFHGNGNPFTSRASGTPADNDAHHLEISQAMNPEDAERFLKTRHAPGAHH